MSHTDTHAYGDTFFIQNVSLTHKYLSYFCALEALHMRRNLFVVASIVRGYMKPQLAEIDMSN